MRREPTTRRVALLVAALLVVSAVVGVGGVAAQSGNETVTDAPTADGANETATSGNDGPPNGTAAARLMGTVGVTEAEVEGEVERRAFGIAVARAASNESKVSVVASQFNQTRERLRELRERRAELNASYENGSISESTYRARVATLAAQVNQTETMINETQEESAGLPEERLEAKGINVTAIQRLRANASNLTGPEVSRIARSIAGPPEGIERGPPEDRGSNRDDADENETETDDRRGPPENVEQGPDGDDEDENETETDDRRGPPENVEGDGSDDADDGNETETDVHRGPPEDRGQNRDDADGNETETDGSTDATDDSTDDSDSSTDTTDDSSQGDPGSGGR